MPLARTGYNYDFQQLSAENNDLGALSIVPWDSEIFGFPVARYRPPATELDPTTLESLDRRLTAWTTRNRVQLCDCAISAANLFWKKVLPSLGFSFVDSSVRAALPSLQRAALPPFRSALRLADAGDFDAVERLASQSFHHGRYHADPRFPRRLADLRYQRWVHRALRHPAPADAVYVIGEREAVKAFFHVAVQDETADLRLAAVAPSSQNTLYGFDLYAATLHRLRDAGVKRVVTSISTAHTRVMNVYARLGFRFSDPELIFHWHAAEGHATGAGDGPATENPFPSS